MARSKKVVDKVKGLIRGVTYDPEPIETEEKSLSERLDDVVDDLFSEEISDDLQSKVDEVVDAILDDGEDKDYDEEAAAKATDFYDPEQAAVDLAGLASLSRSTKQSMAVVTDKQMRLIIDNYYQTQHYRMNISNQIRAVNQGFDDVQEGETPAIAWLLADVKNRENQIKLMINEYAKNNPVCQWAMTTVGIGPVFAANLWSYIDMTKCQHANQFLSYAGLNDNNAPWLGKDKATKLVNEAYKKFELSDKDPANDDVFLYIAVNAGRSIVAIKRGFKSHKDKDPKTNDKAVLIKFLSKPPYNKELKKVCYLIGESFCKVSNRGSLYGEIYKERKALETMRNENLEYADQAAKLLEEKNYTKGTDTYNCLIQGKLSPAHITMRAKRYAVKIFLTHFFEACYIYTHKKNPPVIYPIAFQGHVDYIEPEVPYEDFFTIL